MRWNQTPKYRNFSFPLIGAETCMTILWHRQRTMWNSSSLPVWGDFTTIIVVRLWLPVLPLPKRFTVFHLSVASASCFVSFVFYTVVLRAKVWPWHLYFQHFPAFRIVNSAIFMFLCVVSRKRRKKIILSCLWFTQSLLKTPSSPFSENYWIACLLWPLLLINPLKLTSLFLICTI